MLVPESVLRAAVREAILKEQSTGTPAIIKLLVADIKKDPQKYLSSKRNKLETITWKGKKYRALGFLEKGNPVALITKSDLKPQDASAAGPFELLGQDKVTLTNAGDTRKYDLTKFRGGKTVTVSVRDNAKSVKVDIVKVDYGDPSISDWAIEVGSYIGMIPGVGTPVDLGSAVLAVIKDPPDYLLGALCVLCSAPVLGLAAGAAKIVGKGVIKKGATTIGKEVSDEAIEKAAEALVNYLKSKDVEISEKVFGALRKQLDGTLEYLEKQMKKFAQDHNVFGVCALTEQQGTGGCARGVEEAAKRARALKKEVDDLLSSVMASSDSVAKNIHYNKKQMLEFFDSDVARLKGLDIVPVEVGGKTMAGAGKFGRAYHVIYKGQPAVAKVIGKGSDVDIWKKIIELSSEMPDNLKKHLPEIKGFPAEDVMVMEALEDLPESVKSVLSVGRPAAADIVGKRLLPDTDIKRYIRKVTRFPVDDWFKVDDLIKAVKEKKNDIFAKEGWTLSAKSVKDLKLMLSMPPSPTQKLTAAIEKASDRMARGRGGVHAKQTLSQEGLDEIQEEVVEEYSRTIKQFLTKEGEKAGWFLPPLPGTPKREYWNVKYVKEGIDSVANEIAGNAQVVIRGKLKEPESFKALPFHGDTEDLAKIDELPPEFQSFYKMLNWLKERGVTWKDVHEENVMMHPKTREMVLTDVGEFIFG